MADQEVIKLLEEIRDLQKLHVENYKDALRNQEAGLTAQTVAMRRQKMTLFVAGLMLVGLVVFLVWSSHPANR